MLTSSHITNAGATGIFRTYRNDIARRVLQTPAMARRGDARGRQDWFLREWMDTLRVRQVDRQREAGWSKATASQLYTGVQSYSPKIVQEAAAALRVQIYELFMPPDEAMALRRVKQSALQIADTQREWQPPQTLEELLPKKSSHKAK